MTLIDLHGLSHRDAKASLELFINENWGKRIKVITGNSEPMKDVVCSLVRFYGLTCKRDLLFGYIIINEH